MAKSIKPLSDGGQEKAKRKPNSARLEIGRAHV